MTRCQRHALALVKRVADQGHRPHAVVYTGATTTFDGQAWINYFTARALERRGFVRIEYAPPEGADLILTNAGALVAEEDPA